MLDLFQFYNLLLVKNLHGIVNTGLLVFDKHNPSEGTRPKCFEAVEVIQAGVVLKDENQNYYLIIL
jgi:hypothetical protein